jgi:hypothetical protein
MIFAKGYQQFSLCHKLSDIVNIFSKYEFPHETLNCMKPVPQNISHGMKDPNFCFGDVDDNETNFLFPVVANSQSCCSTQENTRSCESKILCAIFWNDAGVNNYYK